MIECLEHAQEISRSSLACDSADLVVLDVVGYELVLHNVAIDVYGVIVRAVANVLKTFIIVPSPEERSVAIWDELSKHIESSVGALVKSVDPMFDSGLLSSLPIWEGTNVTCSVNVWGSRLQEWVANDSSLSIEFDSSFLSFEEFGGRSNTCSYNYHIDL